MLNVNIMETGGPAPDGSGIPEVLCVGQAVVDCITKNIQDSPDGSGRRVADSITLNAGGDAVNEASALAGMGRNAAILCCVGDDNAGRIILERAKRSGVNTDFVAVRPDMETPVANIIVQADGSRSSISSKASLLSGDEPDLAGALRAIREAAIKEAAKEPAIGETSNAEKAQADPGQGVKVVSFASLFRAPLDDPAVIRKLIKEAHESGAIICADTKLPTFRRTELYEIADVLPYIDYFFPNEEEAAYYTDMDEPREAVTELLSMGIKGVVVKRGANGIFAGIGWENPAVGCGESFCATCLASSCSIRDSEKIRGGEMFALPAIPVDAVDTTGAGDHFVAGFITALLKKKDFRFCCGMGLAAAARCIVRTGG